MYGQVFESATGKWILLRNLIFPIGLVSPQWTPIISRHWPSSWVVSVGLFEDRNLLWLCINSFQARKITSSYSLFFMVVELWLSTAPSFTLRKNAQYNLGFACFFLDQLRSIFIRCAVWAFLICYWQQSARSNSGLNPHLTVWGTTDCLSSVKFNMLWDLTHIFMVLSFSSFKAPCSKVSPCPPCAGNLAHPRGWDRPPGQFCVSYEPLHRAAAERAGTAQGLQHLAQSLIYAAEDPWSGKVREISSKPSLCKAFSVFCSPCDCFI